MIVKRWIYSGQLSPVAELDSAGNVVSRFVGSYMIKGGNTYQLITDHLGSVRSVVNVITGEIVQRLDYDEYGNVLANSNPDFQPFAYAGGLYDSQTKLVRFGARDYDAQTGRWTTKDPIMFAGGETSLYGYVGNDPINRFDRNGLQGIPTQIGKAINNVVNAILKFFQSKDAVKEATPKEMEKSFTNDIKNESIIKDYRREMQYINAKRTAGGALGYGVSILDWNQLMDNLGERYGEDFGKYKIPPGPPKKCP